jgi:uroporphyrinogen decarboxylase
MKPKERAIRAIEHEEPDRVPLNIEIRTDVMKKLYTYFELNDANYSQDEKEEALLKRLGIDFRSVSINPPIGYKPKLKVPDEDVGGWKRERYVLYEEWRIKMKASIDGKQSRIVYHPLQHIDLNDYEFPDIDAIGRFDEAERKVKKYGEKYAVIGSISISLFTHAWFLRGFMRFIRDLYMNSKFVNKLLDRLLEWVIKEGRRFVEIGVDICAIGDDFGMQTGLIISPQLWRKYFKPRYQKLFRELKNAGNVYIFFHSDGNIEQIIPDLIEIGVDILDPVQPECMDVIRLKELYGHRLTFHGTISIQKTLPFGKVDDVKNEVITRIKTLGYNGGLVIAPKQLMYDVPIENILALYDTAKKYGKYPISHSL